MIRLPPRPTRTDPPFPYTTRFRSRDDRPAAGPTHSPGATPPPSRERRRRQGPCQQRYIRCTIPASNVRQPANLQLNGVRSPGGRLVDSRLPPDWLLHLPHDSYVRCNFRPHFSSSKCRLSYYLTVTAGGV